MKRCVDLENSTLPAVISRSNSEAARQLDEQLSKVNQRLHRSVALGAESAVRGELADAYLECSEANWDGYNALPVDPDSFALAKTFLMALPLGTRSPSVGAHPDGQLSLEWYSGPRRSLTISFDPAGELHYAALAGPSRACGTEAFEGEVPQIILELIELVS
jgi:hypothetical protein